MGLKLTVATNDQITIGDGITLTVQSTGRSNASLQLDGPKEFNFTITRANKSTQKQAFGSEAFKVFRDDKVDIASNVKMVVLSITEKQTQLEFIAPRSVVINTEFADKSKLFKNAKKATRVQDGKLGLNQPERVISDDEDNAGNR